MPSLPAWQGALHQLALFFRSPFAKMGPGLSLLPSVALPCILHPLALLSLLPAQRAGPLGLFLTPRGYLKSRAERGWACVLPGFCKEVARGISIQSHTASPAQAVCFRCGSSAAGAHGGGEEEKKIALFFRYCLETVKKRLLWFYVQ